MQACDEDGGISGPARATLDCAFELPRAVGNPFYEQVSWLLDAGDNPFECFTPSGSSTSTLARFVIRFTRPISHRPSKINVTGEPILMPDTRARSRRVMRS